MNQIMKEYILYENKIDSVVINVKEYMIIF